MVLSGAERQKRFRERLKAVAREGVTPDMIVEVAKLGFDREEPEDRGFATWDEYLQYVGKRGNQHHWGANIPTYDPDVPEDVALAREWYGRDADLILKVSPVVRAVLKPPTAPPAAKARKS